MGATIVPGTGVTFRVWAPPPSRSTSAATSTVGHRTSRAAWSTTARATGRASSRGSAKAPSTSSIVEGTGSTGYKRDAYARELTRQPGIPLQQLRRPEPRQLSLARPGIPDAGLQRPDHLPAPHRDLLRHRFARQRQPPSRVCTFLDVLDRLEYLVDLGINALEPLPIVEFPTETSEGYNGTDYYSPEMEYTIPPGPGLDRYFDLVNQLLQERGCAPCRRARSTRQVNQLKALVDVCHVYGIAVLLDVVYNHAGGGFDDDSIYFLDRQPTGDNNRSLYFTDQGYVGGLIFAYWNADVRQFLIDNAAFFVEEFHVDGFRYDEVTVIDQFGGWGLCQNLTDTLHFIKPKSMHMAEYWNPDQSWAIRPTSIRRRRLRCGLVAAAPGRGARGDRPGGRRGRRVVSLIAVRDGLYPPVQFPGGLAVGPVRREPRHRLRRQRPAGRQAQRLAATPGPGTPAAARGGDRPAPDGPRHPPALHGPGIPGGQELERQRQEPLDLLGRPEHRSVHAGSSALLPRADRPAPASAGPARRGDQRLPRPRCQPGDRLPALDRRRRAATSSWPPA